MEPNNINQNLNPQNLNPQTPPVAPTPTPVTTPSPLPPTPEPIIPPIQQGVSSFNQPKEPKPIGPMIGAFIIIALLIAAAVYFWGQKLNNQESNTQIQDTPTTQVSPTIQDTPTTQTTSTQTKDEYSEIESSIDASVEGIDDYNF